jgi:hypothetical protein
MAFAAAAGTIVWGHAAQAHDQTVTALGTPAEGVPLYDNGLLDIARKAGQIISGAAADRRRVATIGTNVEAQNRQGGGHISRPETRSP